MSNAGTVAAKQVATDTTSAAVSEQVNRLGVIGSAFGNSMAGVFRHTVATTPSATPPPAAKSGQAAGSGGVLLEMTAQKGSFSANPVSEAFFQIPAGYVKVE
jgi:hypothetical protein